MHRSKLATSYARAQVTHDSTHNTQQKKTTHISVSRLGGGSKGSRSAAGGDTAVRRALARAIKSIYPRNPISTFDIAWRTPMDGITTARSGSRRQRGMGRVARCSHQSKPPQPPHGAQAPHSSQKRLTKQHKKKDDSHLCKSSWWWEQRESNP